MNPDELNAKLAEYEAMVEQLKKEDPERYLQFLQDLLPQLQEMEAALKESLEDEGVA